MPADRLILADRPVQRGVGFVRRGVDLLVVLLLCPLFLPLLLVLVVLVKLDSPGPAFFRQARLGAGGGRFEMLKLRTMVIDAEKMKESMLHLNVLTWPDFKLDPDPRVTRIGRWLRATSLDELPQLWHLLTGEMTLLGPRACSVRLENYEAWHTERLDHRPGLFGLWQAERRASGTFDDRCRIEISDARSRSGRRDAVLVLRTVAAVLRRDGAR